jgi:misacylated tRNA(Ala) deacylase
MQEKLHLKYHPGTNPPPFSTKIIKIEGNNLFFNESYCFPRGGGQPGDIGLIRSDNFQSPLLETLPGEFIIHPVESVEFFNLGDNVVCEIDIGVRNNNTKMHTTQHIISALADDLFNAETVGNQISSEHTRIDLKFPDREKFNVEDLETSFNDYIKSDAAVKIHNWDRKTILSNEKIRNTGFLHRIPKSIPKIRVVEIEDIDLCPCGGTHVNSIGNLDELKILNVKSKGAGKLRISY